jgi:hypothetical protein
MKKHFAKKSHLYTFRNISQLKKGKCEVIPVHSKTSYRGSRSMTPLFLISVLNGGSQSGKKSIKGV